MQQTTHLDVLGQTGSPAGLPHVCVKSVPGRPVVHARGRYDHYVFDATTLELSVQRQHAAIALVDEHDHPASRTVRYVVQELLGRVDLVAFHLWNQEYDIITGAMHDKRTIFYYKYCRNSYFDYNSICLINKHHIPIPVFLINYYFIQIQKF